jgi:prepilin-type N-terminal cleavage/methylation domain-containing protein
MRRTTVSPDAGFTVVELMVVLLLMSIVSAIVYNVLIDSTRTVARATNSTVAENNGRLALRTVSEDVRAAEQIFTSTSTTACASATYPAAFGNCLGFLVPHEVAVNATTTTIAVGASPIACPFSKITYGLKSGVLREDRSDYNSQCQLTSSFTGKAMLPGIDNTASQPLFTYYDTFGNQLGSANTVQDYQRAGSISMQIQLLYQKGAPDISLMTTAALRNDR